MATLSELVNTIANVEGVDPAGVSLIARGVREAGLITTGGRGPSAAKMTATDAANLLIAINATTSVRAASQIVHSYRELEANVGEQIKPKPKLGEAIEHLLEAVLNRSLPGRYISSVIPEPILEEFRKEHVRIELLFHKPFPAAELTIAVCDPKKDIGYIGGLHPGEIGFDLLSKNATRIEFKFNSPTTSNQSKRVSGGDRKDTTSIGYPTLRAVVELLRE
jgi:hypothetical protein